eukprot:2621578-Alexandrium_andersonii.AAC.1
MVVVALVGVVRSWLCCLVAWNGWLLSLRKVNVSGVACSGGEWGEAGATRDRCKGVVGWWGEWKV